jgi:inner membrane protein
MRFKTGLKIGIILVLGLLLFMPLGMIEGLIGERKALRDGVVRDIGRESVDAQRLIGPIVTVPYKQRVVDTVTEEKDGKATSTKRERFVEGQLSFLPERLAIAGDLTPEERRRGIYKAILYDAALAVEGRFVLPANYGIAAVAVADYEFGMPALAVGIADPRGIGGGIQLEWQGEKIEFGPGARAPGMQAGVTAELGRLDSGGSFDFRYGFALKGLSRVDFVPTSKDSVVRLKGAWPHPSFYGRYLPKHEIDDKGFSAEWRTSLLSTNIRQIYDGCLMGRKCGELDLIAHGVALFQPADIYQQLERSAKYGFLFIGLTFIAFFLFEVLRRLQIHPVQYGLVGVALAAFFLLLTSLSEHIDFALAYAIASAACVALIGFYVCYVLASLVRGLMFAGMLAGLYGMLFVLVRAEENALLMGSLALFTMLAVVMIATRKVNWYEVEAPLRQAATPSPTGGGWRVGEADPTTER